MSAGESRTGMVARIKSTNQWIAIVTLIVALIIATALAAVAWQMSRPSVPVGPPGSLQSVMLTNGQVYYGTLLRAGATSIALSNVFYVQNLTDTRTNQPVSKLVSRAKEDWHAPTLMLIPMDKIVFVEIVGPQSRVAQLIAENMGKQ